MLSRPRSFARLLTTSVHKRYAGYVCAGYVNIIGYPTESMMFPLNPHNFAGKVALSRIQPPFS